MLGAGGTLPPVCRCTQGDVVAPAGCGGGATGRGAGAPWAMGLGGVMAERGATLTGLGSGTAAAGRTGMATAGRNGWTGTGTRGRGATTMRAHMPHIGWSAALGMPRRGRRRLRGPDTGGRKPHRAASSLPSR